MTVRLDIRDLQDAGIDVELNEGVLTFELRNDAICDRVLEDALDAYGLESLFQTRVLNELYTQVVAQRIYNCSRYTKPTPRNKRKT